MTSLYLQLVYQSSGRWVPRLAVPLVKSPGFTNLSRRSLANARSNYNRNMYVTDPCGWVSLKLTLMFHTGESYCLIPSCEILSHCEVLREQVICVIKENSPSLSHIVKKDEAQENNSLEINS